MVIIVLFNSVISEKNSSREEKSADCSFSKMKKCQEYNILKTIFCQIDKYGDWKS